MKHRDFKTWLNHLYGKLINCVILIYVLLCRKLYLLLVVMSFSYVAEDMREAVRDNTSKLWRCFRTRHGISFTSAGLPVREYSTIISLQHFIHDRSCSFIVYIDLSRICVKDSIETEKFWRFALSCIRIYNGYFAV